MRLGVLSICHTWMYVSSRKSVDMKIHIIKYEEGFFIDSVKVRSKIIVKITIEYKV